MPILHQIEDLQFLCFAVVFGIMFFQGHRGRTIGYVWCSYLLTCLVAVIDLSVSQPLTLLANALILSILSLRYAVLAGGLASFTGRSRQVAVISFTLAAVSCLMLLAAAAGLPRNTLLACFYAVLSAQMLVIGVILVLSAEDATRIPRRLLALLFLLSGAYRVNQMVFVLSSKTPHDIWMRDIGVFLNSTILGCLLPFTIVWMMNARDHAVLLQQSLIDPLTGLLNRRGLADAATRELLRYERERKDFAVAVCDIDHFKALNDAHGHAFGDEVLAATARLLRDELRQIDVVARTGGEEFLLMLPLIEGGSVLPLLERLRARLAREEFIAPGDVAVRTTVSIGVTTSAGRDGILWRDLEHEADTALYQAKQSGRNRVVNAVADAMLSASRR